MPVQLIALDLDGTSLQPDQTLSPRLKAAVEEAQRQGIIVYFASGRWHSLMQNYCQELNFKPDAPQASCNGAVIISAAGLVLEKTGIPKNVFQQLIAQLNAMEIAFGVCDELQMYRNLYAQQRGLYNMCPTKNDFKQMAFVSKLIIGPSPNNKAAQIAAGMGLNIAMAEELHTEAWAAQTDKGTALSHIARSYSISLENTMAVGDGENDIGMLKTAGIGVAMGQGSPKAKAAANETAPSVEQDGAAWAIERFALI